MCWPNQQLVCEFHGEASHAAAAPEQGRNALDAAVLAYMNVAALRQHIGAGERVHGVFTHGGDKPNIVPKFAAMHWYVRSPSADGLAALEPRVVSAIEAGAQAAGCSVEITRPAPAYDDMWHLDTLLGRFANNIADRDRIQADMDERPDFVGSTDMGNISHHVPSIHPMLAVAPRGVAIHTPEFAGFAAGPEGDRAVIDGAIGMARTAVDLWSDAALLANVRDEFSTRSRLTEAPPTAPS